MLKTFLKRNPRSLQEQYILRLFYFASLIKQLARSSVAPSIRFRTSHLELFRKVLRLKRDRGVGLQGGFSLIEALVAISILLVAIAGPMTIAARGLQTAFYAREQVTGFSLAQEGVELVRAWRDGNALLGAPWLAGLPGVCTSNSHGCGIDARASGVVNCNVPNNCRLNYDEGDRGFYTHAAGAPTPFIRRIWIDPVSGPGGNEAEVVVEVSWESGFFASERNVTVRSRIFNQYDNI
ncbi:prepilin-type N-terminal cleavage/methylation domain-containing protein [Candidatus Kaiserbacteria bacterium]|nr:prepilin-type N-terminal cleavage/methylation domain-containing protein [Candidatus Kaiserbacteria bacterium]